MIIKLRDRGSRNESDLNIVKVSIAVPGRYEFDGQRGTSFTVETGLTPLEMKDMILNGGFKLSEGSNDGVKGS